MMLFQQWINRLTLAAADRFPRPRLTKSICTFCAQLGSNVPLGGMTSNSPRWPVVWQMKNGNDLTSGVNYKITNRKITMFNGDINYIQLWLWAILNSYIATFNYQKVTGDTKATLPTQASLRKASIARDSQCESHWHLVIVTSCHDAMMRLTCMSGIHYLEMGHENSTLNSYKII